jgi:Dyp-type peroxidase family
VHGRLLRSRGSHGRDEEDQVVHPLNLSDIQGNVTPGFRKDFQEFLFVDFGCHRREAREWVGEVRPEIASAEAVALFNRLYQSIRARSRDSSLRHRYDVARFARATWVNVAFSWRGLQKLLADQDRPLPAEIQADRLPEEFRRGFGGAPEEDALLLLGADSARDLDAELRLQRGRLARLGLRVVESHRGQTLGDAREHFGFRDALSQPDPPDPLAGWPAERSGPYIAPGEFVIGCQREERNTSLEPDPAWTHGGSYLVFWQLEQRVDEFRAAMEREATKLSRQGVTMSPDLLAAKMIGRWPSGARLTKTPESEQPVLRDPVPGGEPPPADMDIAPAEFARDRYGDGCPLFAHIRRAHPRDGDPRNDASNPRLHRLIRRGIPYTSGSERGLLFLSYQASIARQFYRVKDDWLGNPAAIVKYPGLQTQPGRDPIMSEMAGHDVQYHRPGRTGELQGDFFPVTLETYVVPKEGRYFFSPAISKLQSLASPTP